MFGYICVPGFQSEYGETSKIVFLICKIGIKKKLTIKIISRINWNNP